MALFLSTHDLRVGSKLQSYICRFLVNWIRGKQIGPWGKFEKPLKPVKHCKMPRLARNQYNSSTRVYTTHYRNQLLLVEKYTIYNSRFDVITTNDAAHSCISMVCHSYVWTDRLIGWFTKLRVAPQSHRRKRAALATEILSSRAITYSQRGWNKERCNGSTLYPDREFSSITWNQDLGKSTL